LIWLWIRSSGAGGMGNSPIYVFLALVAGSALCLALTSADTGLGKFLAARPLRYVGTISYGLYLIHPFVFGAISKKAQNVAGLTTALLLSFLLAALSWHFMERRVLEFRTVFLREAKSV